MHFNFSNNLHVANFLNLASRRGEGWLKKDEEKEQLSTSQISILQIVEGQAIVTIAENFEDYSIQLFFCRLRYL